MSATIDSLIKSKDLQDGYRRTSQASNFVNDFWDQIEAGNIKKIDDALKSDLKKDVETFILHSILPVSWYNRKISDAYLWRNFYLASVMLMTIGLPIGVAFLPWILGLKSTPSVVAQLTAALTGVFALQKTLGAWLGQQQQFGAWRKTSADLKKIWYGFQTSWAGTEISNQKDAFVKALRDKSAEGRELVEQEEVDFFQKLTLPTVDVLDLLTRSRPDTASMIGALLPGIGSAAAATTAAATRVTDDLKAHQDLVRYSALLDNLDKEIKIKSDSLKSATEGKQGLEAELNVLIKRRGEVTVAKMEAQAAITASSR